MKPLCFVIMPFGEKTDANGRKINFDQVYENFIMPVIEEAGLEPIRADHEMMGGIIHKPMYERLILCDFAIADLTTANANVFYELGIRYTAKPYTTFSIFETGTKIPFDLVDVRCFPYTIENDEIIDLENKKKALITYIQEIKKKDLIDSPVYQLLDGIEFSHNLSKDKVDMLREQAQRDNQINEKIQEIIGLNKKLEEEKKALQQQIKESGDSQLKEKMEATLKGEFKERHQEIVGQLVNLEKDFLAKEDWDVGLAINFILAFRSLSAFKEMAETIESLPDHIKGTRIFQEQYGFALNRTGNSDKAIEVLKALIDEKGPDSETLGILGRAYKDQYNQAKSNSPILAKGFLNKAIETYTIGFQTDLRNYYPGVNAATLKFVRKDEDAADFANVVEYSVLTYLGKNGAKISRNIPSNFEDYWPQASLLELAILQNDEEKAAEYLSNAISTPHESWQTESTAKNLELYKTQGDWVDQIIDELLKH